VAVSEDEAVGRSESEGRPICESNIYGLVKRAICDAVDLPSSATDDGNSSEACDALSVAIRLEALPASISRKPYDVPDKVDASTPCDFGCGGP
jgi:hypothetical protein